MTEVQRLAKIIVLKDLFKEYELLAKYNGGTDYDRYCALDMAIKALEQEPVLDKIRAEIEKAVWEDVVVSLDGTDEVRIPLLSPDDVFEIIDKYRQEG